MWSSTCNALCLSKQCSEKDEYDNVIKDLTLSDLEEHNQSDLDDVASSTSEEQNHSDFEQQSIKYDLEDLSLSDLEEHNHSDLGLEEQEGTPHTALHLQSSDPVESRAHCQSGKNNSIYMSIYLVT